MIEEKDFEHQVAQAEFAYESAREEAQLKYLEEKEKKKDD
jgi:hypothetical protein